MARHGHLPDRGDIRRSGGFVISGLTSGHGVFHWFSQSFLVMLPQVQATFGLSEVGVGAIATVREMVSGIVNLPGGVVVDMLRRYWGLVLAICMGGFGVGWLVMGISPVYPVLLLGMVLIGVFSSTWHLPAMASLSHHFSHRRGTARSFHAIGGAPSSGTRTFLNISFASWLVNFRCATYAMRAAPPSIDHSLLES